MKYTLTLLIILLGIANIALFIRVWEINSTEVKSVSYSNTCFDSDMASQIHCLTNEVRGNNGLKPLEKSNLLVKASKAKSEDMCKNNYFAHDYKDQKWTRFIEESRFIYTRAGENLAKGFKDAESAVNGLVNSPKHYDNLVGDFTHLGVYTLDCNGMSLTTQTFGKL